VGAADSGARLPSVVEAVEKANAWRSFGACTPAEAELAEAGIEASIDGQVRF